MIAAQNTQDKSFDCVRCLFSLDRYPKSAVFMMPIFSFLMPNHVHGNVVKCLNCLCDCVSEIWGEAIEFLEYHTPLAFNVR